MSKKIEKTDIEIVATILAMRFIRDDPDVEETDPKMRKALIEKGSKPVKQAKYRVKMFAKFLKEAEELLNSKSLDEWVTICNSAYEKWDREHAK